uniref:ARAD1C13134p n=1 Tax=Blastobotrys adeninivorans TaxID=409370 RepID=A0A060T5K0_BLAAD
MSKYQVDNSLVTQHQYFDTTTEQATTTDDNYLLLVAVGIALFLGGCKLAQLVSLRILRTRGRVQSHHKMGLDTAFEYDVEANVPDLTTSPDTETPESFPNTPQYLPRPPSEKKMFPIALFQDDHQLKVH